MPLGSKLPNGLTVPLLSKARHSHGGTPDDQPTGPDARVDVTLRSMLSPNRGGSSPRHKSKTSDAV